MKEYEFHPLANSYPLLEGDDFVSLANDIETNGLQSDILIAEEKIADGRNRYLACKDRKIEPRFSVWDGSGDLATLIDSLNLHRRHLTQEQKEERRAKRVEAVAEKRREGKSLRTIAEEEKVSESQVRRDLATAPGGAVEPAEGKVKGKDGRKRTAKPRSKGGKSSPKTAAKKPKTEEDPMDEADKDDDGGEGGSDLVVLKSFVGRKSFSAEEFANRKGNTGKYGARHAARNLNLISASAGFIVMKLPIGDYRVHKAVHFAWEGSDAPPSFKQQMKELYKLALHGMEMDNDCTKSNEWGRKERSDFLQEVVKIVAPLTKG